MIQFADWQSTLNQLIHSLMNSECIKSPLYTDGSNDHFGLLQIKKFIVSKSDAINFSGLLLVYCQLSYLLFPNSKSKQRKRWKKQSSFNEKLSNSTNYCWPQTFWIWAPICPLAGYTLFTLIIEAKKWSKSLLALRVFSN